MTIMLPSSARCMSLGRNKKENLTMGILSKIFGSSDKAKDGFAVGDWVNSYSKGVYRIEFIIDEYYDESSHILNNNEVGDKQELRTIVSKRLLNSNFKKSISYESCSEAFISHLNNSQNVELKKVLTEIPTLLKDLENYKIPIRTAVYNSYLQIENRDELNLANQLVGYIKNGKTFLQIENEMKRLDIVKPMNYGNYDFQFFNYDNEYIDKRMIWKDAILKKK